MKDELKSHEKCKTEGGMDGKEWFRRSEEVKN